MVETPSPQERRKIGLWVWALALVLIAAVVIGGVLARRSDDGGSALGAPSTSAQPSTSATQPKAHRVTRFSGDTGTTTKPFTVALNWEVRWTAASGSGFVVELLKADGTSRGQIVRAGSKSAGSTFVGEKGTFRLKITSSRAWTIQIFSR